MTHSIKFAIFCVGLVVVSSCTTVREVALRREVQTQLRKGSIFPKQMTGLMLYDPALAKTLAEKNAQLAFTPASNVKLLTLLACLQYLPDSIPTFTYTRTNDTLHLQPLGDPTFLHPEFPHQPSMQAIRSTDEPVVIHLPIGVAKFGPGWAWDDYEYEFQTQRNAFPIYANAVRIYHTDSLYVAPAFFQPYVQLHLGMKPGDRVYREEEFNLFHIWQASDTSRFERKIPFRWSEELLLRLLTDTLQKPISSTTVPLSDAQGAIYNQATKPVLALMMQRSDNFLAEQLLICAANYAGFHSVDDFRMFLLEKWELPESTQWVDGSGLSRYNLISPAALVQVLQRIQQQLDTSEIAFIFPNGGKTGTLRYWYGGDPTYVFAKTGTLRHNHCLSGYLLTRSGKWLVFSIMNNHYTVPLAQVKQEMQRLLEHIRDAY